MNKYFLSVLMMSFFAFSLSAQTQFENPGFEEWEEVGLGPDLIEPVNWSSLKTSDDDELSGQSPVVWGRSEDAHSGNYSVYLKNFGVFGIVATGIITNGRVHPDTDPDLGYVFTDVNDDRWHTKFTGRPDSVVGWYKANPMPGDNPAFRVVLHKGYQALPGGDTNLIAEARMDLPGEVVTEWTRFSAPFIYESDEQPEFMLAIFYSGNGTNAISNSEAWFDDVEMVYPTSVPELTADDLKVYYAYGELHVKLIDKHQEDVRFQVIDLLGHVVFDREIRSQFNNKFDLNLPTGIYIATVTTEGQTVSKKLLVR